MTDCLDRMGFSQQLSVINNVSAHTQPTLCQLRKSLYPNSINTETFCILSSHCPIGRQIYEWQPIRDILLGVVVENCNGHDHGKQKSSAKLTNQRVSYAFTSSQLSYHTRHILLTSKFQNSYSCILLIFLQTLVTVKACVRTVSVNTVHWFDTSSSDNANE